MEDDLLLLLSAAEGSFLDDTKLVERLEMTKATAAEIERKVGRGQGHLRVWMRPLNGVAGVNV